MKNILLMSAVIISIMPMLLGQTLPYNCESATAFVVFDTTSNIDKIVAFHQLKNESTPDTIFLAYKRPYEIFLDCACNDSLVTIQKIYGTDIINSTSFVTFKKDKERSKSKWKWQQQYVRILELHGVNTGNGDLLPKVISDPKLLGIDLISYTETERDLETMKTIKVVDYVKRLKSCRDPIFHPEEGYEVVSELERN